MITASRNKNRSLGKQRLIQVINSLKSGVPAPRPELAVLGSTLNGRRVDLLSYTDYPETRNGPTEAVNRHFEHLRGTASAYETVQQ